MRGFRIFLSLAVFLLGASLPAHAAREEIPEFTIELRDGTITPKRIEVPEGTRFKFILKNTGKEPAEFESLELRKEKVVAPGVTTSMVFKRLSAGEYVFFDDFHLDGDKALVVSKPADQIAPVAVAASDSSPQVQDTPETAQAANSAPLPIRIDGKMPVYLVQLQDGNIIPKRLEVLANSPFKLELQNTGKEPAEFESLELRKEKVIAPGVTTSMVFKRLVPGEHVFFDDFHLDGDKAIIASIVDLPEQPVAVAGTQPPSPPSLSQASSETAANAASSDGAATESAASGQLTQIAFVIWRESVEALLIIGILNAWLVHEGGEARGRGRRFLWGGVLGGLVLATVLGGALLFLGDSLSEEGQEYFLATMVLVATVLILQMVLWMRKHGRTMRSDLEKGAAQSVARIGWWGVAIVAAVAVAREGSETVVFLYGIMAGGGSISALSMTAATVLGLGSALLTYALLQVGGRILSWRLFFRATEIMLLFLALALLMTGIDKLVSLDVLPTLSGPLWNTDFLIDDRTTWGSMIASLTGYRARPDATNLIVYALYWGGIFLFMFRPSPRKSVHASAPTSAS